jgi:hypothetical protein
MPVPRQRQDVGGAAVVLVHAAGRTDCLRARRPLDIPLADTA